MPAAIGLDAGERGRWILMVAPLLETASMTSAAPSGSVMRTVAGKVPTPPGSVMVMFSGRTDTVTAEPTAIADGVDRAISAPASSRTRSAAISRPCRKLACPMNWLTNRLEGRS